MDRARDGAGNDNLSCHAISFRKLRSSFVAVRAPKVKPPSSHHDLSDKRSGEFVEVRRSFFVERRDAFLRLSGVVEQLQGMKGEIADAANVIGVGVEGTLCQRDC